MPIELRVLQHALAVARHGNFARAANELHLTQPSLSRSVATLERALGVTLFDRTHKGVSPTAFGRILMERAGLVLDREADLRREIQLLAGLEVGTLTVAAGPYPGESTVAEAMARVTTEHPRLQVSLEVMAPEQVHEAVLSGKVDVGVAATAGLGRNPRLHAQPLPPRRICWGARPGHPLARSKRISVERLFDYPVVTTRLTGQGRRGKTPPVMVNSVAVARVIARNSDGIAPATYQLLKPDLDAGSLIILDVQPTTLRTTHAILTLKDRSLSPAARKFIDRLQEIEAEVDDHEPATRVAPRRRGARRPDPQASPRVERP